MNAQEALEASIVHWEENLQHAQDGYFNSIETGPISCALCVEFNKGPTEAARCKGCPVYEKTGRQFCQSTPYEGVEIILEAPAPESEPDFGGYKFTVVTAIQAELDFLKSLRKT